MPATNKHLASTDAKRANEFWHLRLLHPISPASGPLTPMLTLLDVARAIAKELPLDRQARPHWQQTATLLVIAARSGSEADIKVLTRQLMRALDVERWSM